MIKQAGTPHSLYSSAKARVKRSEKIPFFMAHFRRRRQAKKWPLGPIISQVTRLTGHFHKMMAYYLSGSNSAHVENSSLGFRFSVFQSAERCTNPLFLLKTDELRPFSSARLSQAAAKTSSKESKIRSLFIFQKCNFCC